MNDRKNIVKFDDYIEPRSPQFNLLNTCSSLNRSLAQFKLDRIYPRNINMKLNIDGKENPGKGDRSSLNKINSHMKGGNNYENKFYHQYINLKEDHHKNKVRKNKISHIFNIKSINLLQKTKLQQQKSQSQKYRLHHKHSSKDLRRNYTEKLDKDDLKGLNFLVFKKKSPSPDRVKTHDKKNANFQSKMMESKSGVLQKNGDDKFDIKLNEYYNYLKDVCNLHGLSLKQIQNYGKNTIAFYVGKGNNGHLIKQTLKKRWWWTLSQDKNKKSLNLVWTQLKQKNLYLQKEKRSISTSSQVLSKTSQNEGKGTENMKEKAPTVNFSQISIHNHFENNQFIGNKKALYYNMKIYYEKQNKNVFDYLPVTFHVKKYNDEAWKQFTSYYAKDVQKHEGQRRLWILKPGQNSNRGNGITVFSDFEKLRQWVEIQLSGQNNSKKTFIIQKYIDRPFLYNKRKFDIRCYMLLVRLNGSIKGYWYNDGYIRTSCYDYHVEDDNTYVHLTNDAIQINCDKYGKYQDGNKLSFHHFQKYLDQHQKGRNFVQDICPQLKKIATDSIEACYHLLGEWNDLPTFQLFGLDFMIDESFKPWLIEINTNPCIETASTTLQRVIPRMLDGAFRLSVDVLFPPPSTWSNSKKHYMPNKVSSNLFQLIFDEGKKSGTQCMMSDQIKIEIGQIQEDDEIYEQPCQKQKKMSANTNT